MPDFKKHFDVLHQIERNVRDYKYSSTHQMSTDLGKLNLDLIRSSNMNLTLNELVSELNLCINELIAEMGLLSKEIFTVQQPVQKVPAKQVDRETKHEVNK